MINPYFLVFVVCAAALFCALVTIFTWDEVDDAARAITPWLIVIAFVGVAILLAISNLQIRLDTLLSQ
jgi:hypothetical protein